MIIGSVFSVLGMAALFIAASSHGPGEKIGLFWPVMFHLLNSVGFAHILPVSLALFSKVAPKSANATVLGLYYLAFFAANSLVGWIGGYLTKMPVPQFWLLHAGLAAAAGLGFIVFKLLLGKRMQGQN